ncbi:MAG: hypothetical protein R2769_04475 [Saprospiraceae bacterium]
MRSGRYYWSNFLALFFFTFFASNLSAVKPPIKDVLVAEENWVDSVLQKMTLDQKIGQLFMIRAHSDKGAAYEKEVRDFIEKYEVGGALFLPGYS